MTSQRPAVTPDRASELLESGLALRRLRRLLAAALVVIAAVTAFALSLVWVRLASSPLEASAVNVVGRQRMLATRLTANISMLSPQAADDPRVRSELNATLRELLSVQDQLGDETRRLGADIVRTAETRDRLARANRHLAQIRSIADEVLADPTAPTDVAPRVNTLRAAGRAFVSEMDALNAALVRQREQRDAWYAWTPPVLGAAILLVLLIAWRWIHLPALRLMESTVRELERERRLRERLALVASNTTNSVIIADREARIEWVNDAFTRLTGYSFDELKGKRPGSFLHGPETDPAVRARMRAAIARGEGFTERVANYTKDGRKYWVAIDCQPLHDRDGNPNGFMAVENDITSMLELERSLVRQAERHTLAMSAASMGVWEWDIVKNEIDYDEHQRALFGVEPGSATAADRDWRTHVLPEDLPRMEESLSRALRGDGDYAAQFRIRRPDGEVRWLSATGLVIRGAWGKPTRMVGVHIDVTERERAEEQRRELDSRLRKLASNIPGSLFVLKRRPDGRLSLPYASDGFRELFGIAPEAAREDASAVFASLHPDDVSQVNAGLNESDRTQRTWLPEFRIASRSSELRWVRGHATPNREPDGSTVWYGVLLDNSSIKRAERREREALASLEEAQALAGVGSWSCDLATGQVEWSRQMFALSGRDPALGPPDYPTVLTYYVEEDRAWFDAAVRRAIETGEPYRGTLRLREPRNGVAVVRAEAKLDVDESGKAVRLFGTVVDITATVERERELERAQAAAEAANRAKSVFLANMSHEIRTPMAAILGFVDLLTDPNLARPQLQEYTTTIQRNAKHLLELINQVLDLTKIEAGQMAIERITCSPGEIAREIVSLMRPRADEKKLFLTLHFAGPIPHTIESDPTRLRQILLNLVGNAIKFTERGGVDVTLALETSGVEPKLEFRVKDSGIGIDAASLTTLFRPFSQADSSTTRRFGGTGLGLSIASHLARLLGGEIETVSTPGVGTLFTVRVATGSIEGVKMLEGESEAQSTEPSTLQLQAPGSAPLAGLRGLLVEDGPDNQRLISLHLTRAGATIEVLGNGQLAIDRLTGPGAPVDFVLMDMQMPVLDGYEATARLRRAGYTGPIIALTAHAMAGDREKCIEAGCDDYATKPIDSKRLYAVIQAHLKRDVAPPQREPVSTMRPLERPPLASAFEDDPDMVEVVEQFVASLGKRVAELEAALAAGDRSTLSRLAHQLKGAGGGYGFEPITDAARQLERILAAPLDEDAIRAGVAELIAICQSARAPRRPEATSRRHASA